MERELNPMGLQQAIQTLTSETIGHKCERTSIHPKVSMSNSVHTILQLQQKFGNRAVKGMIQAKLKIGWPGDVYEQEADRVADQVLRMPEPHIDMTTSFSRKAGDDQIQRLCSVCEHEEEKVKEQSGQIPSTPILEGDLNAIRGGGNPLPHSVRTFF